MKTLLMAQTLSVLLAGTAHAGAVLRGRSVQHGTRRPPLSSLRVQQSPEGSLYTLTAAVKGWETAGTELHTAFSLILNAPNAPMSTDPSLGSITGGTYHLKWADIVRSYDFHGRIIQVLTPVPLPPTVLLFGAGLLP